MKKYIDTTTNLTWFISDEIFENKYRNIMWEHGGKSGMVIGIEYFNKNFKLI